MAYNFATLGVEVKPKGIKKTERELEQMTREGREAERMANRLGTAAAGAGGHIRGMGGQAGGVLSRLMQLKGVIVGIGSAIAALGLGVLAKQFADMTVSILKVGDTFEQLKIRLVSLRGSADQAAKDFDWIRQAAIDMPLELEDVTGAFTTLVAFGLEPTDGTLQKIVDSASQVGPPMQTLDVIVQSLGRSYAKNKIQTMEMYRMMEKGVPATRLLAEAMNKSEAAVVKMMEAGELGREHVLMLLDAMGSRAAGAASNQMVTLSGRLSNLEDAWVEMMNSIATAGPIDAAKELLTVLNDKVNEIAEGGKAQEIGAYIADVIHTLTATLPKVVDSVVSLTNAIPQLVLVLKDFRDVAEGIFKVGGLLWQGIEYLSQFPPKFNAMGVAIGTLAAPLVGLSAGIAAIIGGFLELLHFINTYIDELDKESEAHTRATKMHNAAVKGMQEAMAAAGYKTHELANELGVVGDETLSTVDAIYKELHARNMAGTITEKHKRILSGMRQEVVGATGDQAAWARQMTETGSALNVVGAAAEETVAGWDEMEKAFEKSEKIMSQYRLGMIEVTDLTGAYRLHILDTLPKMKTYDQDITRLTKSTGPQGLTGAIYDAIKAETQWVWVSKEVKEELSEIEEELSEIEKAAISFSNEFKQSITSMFSGTFKNLLEGELDSLGDFFIDSFTNMGQMVGETFINSMVEAMFSKDVTIKDSFDSLFGAADPETGKGKGAMRGAAGVMGGLGMWMAGQQQGGLMGFLSGGLGGASIALAAGMTNPIGIVAIGIAAGLAALFGSKEKETPWFDPNFTGEGWQVQDSGGHLGMTHEKRELWARDMNYLTDTTEQAYRQLLELFNSPELFDLVGTLDSMDFAKWEGQPQEFAQWIEDVWLPEQFEGMFGPAIRQGLEDLPIGLSSGAIDAFFDAITDMPGPERIQAMTQFIETMIVANDYLVGFAQLQEKFDRSVMDQYAEAMSGASDQIVTLMADWDNLNILERGDQLARIGTVWQGVLQVTEQQLGALKNLAESIDMTFSGAIENIQVSEMNPQQQATYAVSRLNELYDLLGRASTPEQVEQFTNEMMKYIQMIQSSGIDMEALTPYLGITGTEGATQSMNDWLIEYMTAANEAAQDKVQFFIDETQEHYDRLYSTIEDLILSFTDLGGWADYISGAVTTPDPDPNQPPGPLGGAIDPEELVGIDPKSAEIIGQNIGANVSLQSMQNITIEIGGDISWLDPFVRAIVVEELLESPDLG